jgi:hypothetical protein
METIDLSVYADNLFCRECGSLLNLGVGDGNDVVCTGCSNVTDSSGTFYVVILTFQSSF